MKNKSELKKRCKLILNSYDINSRISKKEDIEFLTSIFNNHPNWEKKKGSGIKGINIMKTIYNGRCFELERYDGTTTDISYIECISPKNKLSKVKKACRDSVKDIIIEFRNSLQYGKIKCPITNEILYRKNTHIDHYNLTFEELFKKWIEDKDVSKIKLKENSIDNEMIMYFEDDYITKDFIHYHNNNTNLRAVSRWANLSVLKNKQNPKLNI